MQGELCARHRQERRRRVSNTVELYNRPAGHSYARSVHDPGYYINDRAQMLRCEGGLPSEQVLQQPSLDMLREERMVGRMQGKLCSGCRHERRRRVSHSMELHRGQGVRDSTSRVDDPTYHNVHCSHLLRLEGELPFGDVL